MIKNISVQYFSHCKNWEDLKNGLYKTKSTNNEEKIKTCIRILGNKDNCFKYMSKVIDEWEISTKVNLTNPDVNKKAWLGQSACCVEHKIPSFITCKAWFKLDECQRKYADEIALKIIKEWLKKYAKENKKWKNGFLGSLF